MAEQLAVEVDVKNVTERGRNCKKCLFLKAFFDLLAPWGVKKLYHMKFKSKTGCLGKKISILPWQMAEQLAVEVDVKNVTDVRNSTDTRTSSFIWLGLILKYLPYTLKIQKYINIFCLSQKEIQS